MVHDCSNVRDFEAIPSGGTESVAPSGAADVVEPEGMAAAAGGSACRSWVLGARTLPLVNSRMVAWCTSLSIAAIVVIGSLKI